MHTALHLSGTHNIRCSTSVQRRTARLRPSHGPECRRLGLTHTFMGEPQRGGRPCKARTHTQYRIYAVRRHDECIAPRQWLRPSPVTHRLVTRRVTEITPPPPRPPTPSATPYPFLVRVEVGRDRHAQKAGCGAVVVDQLPDLDEVSIRALVRWPLKLELQEAHSEPPTVTSVPVVRERANE